MVAAVLTPVAAFLTAGATAFPNAREKALCCAEIIAAPAAPRPADGTSIVGGAPGTTMIVAARAVTRDMKFMLPVGVASEKGLQVKSILAARAISAMFPEIHAIGGVRADALRWHPNGLALDVMIPDYHSPAGTALGDRIVQYVLDNSERFGINHVIWRQTLYMPGKAPRSMANYGSDDANHYTHVHVATEGGGYPTGLETYFTSADGPGMSNVTVPSTALGVR